MVKLISITKPLLEEIKDFTPEEVIVYIARVSNPSNQMNKETSPKLLKYLIEHKHWSPFEFVDMTVEITTRRSIAAQILRHKSFNFQEFSGRYSNALGIEDIELRKQAEKNRQSSVDVITDNKELRGAITDHIEHSMKLYKQLLDAGIAREVARDVLPLSTETKLYMKGSVRSWLHYLEVRLKEDTQKEHRIVAQGVSEIFSESFPIIHGIISG